MAVRLVVQAGEHDREQCPVSVHIQESARDPRKTVLVSECCGQAFPCQIQTAEDGVRVSWILPGLPAGEEKAFLLKDGTPDTGGVELDHATPGKIDVSLRGVPFTSFHFAETWSRPFLHPIIGPFGDPITRAYPVIPDVPGEKQDHPHHKSFWVAWGDVNGTDNWSENQEKGHAKQCLRTVRETAAGPAFGRIAITNDWISEKGEKVLEEDREMVFHNLPATARAVDLKVTFRATRGPVRFGDTKEGGICSIRVATTMDASGDGTIVNSFGGTNEGETWGKRAHWCDYVGPVAGKTVGIAIFDHPQNLGHPTYWHVRNYGLMTANPFGLSHFLKDKTIDGSFRMEPGTKLTFQYRVLFHAGDTKAANVAGKYHDFINPPNVIVTEEQ